ncbi:MAG: ModD protein [Gammaproteobacteria bacterium]|nr:ModD protein [Gammaproteobacteria bacterium]
MIFFRKNEIESWIEEDAPLVDLTSHLLGINGQLSILSVQTRHPICVTLTEEAARIFEQLGAVSTELVPSGTRVDAGVTLLKIKGRADALHRGWKVAMNLLEHFCGIATRTAEMVDQVRKISSMPVLVTRKHMPGMKKAFTKSILAGGAHPHRLGLSETVLIFENHLKLAGGREQLPAMIAQMKGACCEKKISVECDTLEHAWEAIEAGTDIVQFDKVSAEALSGYCQQIRTKFPVVSLLAAGGIRPENVQDYARSGVDGLVLSSVYHAPPADLKVSIDLS